MLKKTITYEDFNGESRTEDFYFNLNKNELAKLEHSKGGGLTEWVKKAVQAKDGKTILDVFDEILAATYGEKSLDNREFVKSPEIFQKFKSTNAYDIIFMDLVTNADSAAEFITMCMPKELREGAIKAIDQEKKNHPELTSGTANNNDASVIKKVES